MSNKFKTFLFGLSVVLAIFTLAAIPMIIAGCLLQSEPIQYYKVQRLNINGDVQKTYYSQSYPYGIDTISFREYPSGNWVKFSAPYNAECLGTNKPVLK
jgi:hypothetical protein